VFSLSSSKASASIQGQKVIFVSKSIFKEESKKKDLALEKILRREEMTRIVSKKTKRKSRQLIPQRVIIPLS
jgi:hypothetical protein